MNRHTADRHDVSGSNNTPINAAEAPIRQLRRVIIGNPFCCRPAHPPFGDNHRGWRGVSPPLDSCVLHKLRKIPFPVFLDGDLKQHNPRWQCKGGRRARVFHRLASVHRLVRSPAGDHDNRRCARFQRGRHGRAPGDRWQDPVRPHQGPKHRLYRGISDGGRHRFQGSAGGWRRGESDRRCTQCAPAYLHHRRDRADPR